MKYILLIVSLLLIYYVANKMLCKMTVSKINHERSHLPKWLDKTLHLHYQKKAIKECNIGQKHLCYFLFYKIYSIMARKEYYYFVTWKKIESLLNSCLSSVKKPDVVVGIKSGGAYISSYIAKYFNVPVYFIEIKRNIGDTDMVYRSLFTSSYTNKNDYIIKDFTLQDTRQLTSKNVLLVDDGILSGGTVKTAHAYLNSCNINNIEIFIMHGKKGNYDYTFCDNQLLFYGPWGLI